MKPLRLLVLLLSTTLGIAFCQGAETQKTAPKAPSVSTQVQLVRADWLAKLPPEGAVNVPAFVSASSPGERLLVVVLSSGEGREELTKRMQLNLTLALGETKVSLKQLEPVAVRRVKAVGADFVSEALAAGGVAQAELSSIAQKTESMSFTVFSLETWIVPELEQGAELTVEGSWVKDGAETAIAMVRVPVKTPAEWYAEPVWTKDALGGLLKRHHPEWCAGHWIQLFHSIASAGMDTPIDRALFTAALRENANVRTALIGLLPELSAPEKSRAFGYLVQSGVSVAELEKSAPGSGLAYQGPRLAQVDPRKRLEVKEPVTGKALSAMGTVMDECWAAWMATGDKDYLLALVNLLDGAEDYALFKKWQAEKSLAKHMNRQAARGLAYQIAGWSVGSFKRSDPLVSDWLLYWRSSPTFPRKTAKEIESLSTNPAFKR